MFQSNTFHVENFAKFQKFAILAPATQGHHSARRFLWLKVHREITPDGYFAEIMSNWGVKEASF